MEEKESNVESLIESIDDYGKTSIHLFKLKAIHQTSEILSATVSYIAISTCIILGLVILNIGAALWLGKELGETYYGFLIVAAFNIFLAIVLYLSRNSLIKTPIINALIKKMHN